MQVPLELTFRNVKNDENIRTLVADKLSRLEKICDYMTSCRVIIDKPQEHQKSGNPFRVRLDISIPHGHEIVVTRESGEGDMHVPLTRVVRDAFDAARRQVQELVERQRNEMKSHPEQIAGAVVAQLFPDEGYGFLRTIDSREIYFHRNSVVDNDFGRLKIGTGVRFVEEIGDNGPQASTVQIVDKPAA